MNRIQKVSAYLLSILNLLLIGVPIITGCLWMFMEVPLPKEAISEGLFFDLVKTPEGVVNLSTVTWSPLSKFIGFTANLVGLLPILFGIYVLKLTFQNYKKGEIFNLINAKYYQYLGWLFFLDGLLIKPLSNMLMVLAVTLTNPPGHRYLQIEYGTPNLEVLFCGMIVLVISWVMAEASRLQQEQEFTI